MFWVCHGRHALLRVPVYPSLLFYLYIKNKLVSELVHLENFV